MAWLRPAVQECPIVKKTQGVVLMEEWVIAELVGAAGEEFEWTCLFLGETDEASLTIRVNNLLVPDQIRNRGHIEIPEWWTPPDHLAPEIVGVVHLHPGLHYNNNVGFSSVDTGPGGLNQRWPMSMVIGRTSNPNNLEAISLGIDYDIYGKCKLPCGSLGIIQYFLLPSFEGVPDPDWPWPQEIVKPTIFRAGVDIQPEPVVPIEHVDLKDCSSYTEGEETTRYELQKIATCGLIETTKWLRPAVFGATGEGILHSLPDVYFHQDKKGKGKHHHYNGRNHESQSIVRRNSCPTKYDDYLDDWDKGGI